jgi:hypothetical protein
MGSARKWSRSIIMANIMINQVIKKFFLKKENEIPAGTKK